MVVEYKYLVVCTAGLTERSTYKKRMGRFSFLLKNMEYFSVFAVKC